MTYGNILLGTSSSLTSLFGLYFNHRDHAIQLILIYEIILIFRYINSREIFIFFNDLFEKFGLMKLSSSFRSASFISSSSTSKTIENFSKSRYIDIIFLISVYNHNLEYWFLFNFLFQLIFFIYNKYYIIFIFIPT